jgi:hypothetical protein
VQVDGDVVGDEPVAGCRAVDPFAADGPAEPAHERGDVAVGAFGGFVVVPQRVDQRAHGDELPATLGEDRERAPRLARRDRRRELSFDREGAQQANPQGRRHR